MKSFILLKQDENKTYAIDTGGTVHELDVEPLVFLNERCIRCGSTIRGRKEAFCRMVHARQKPAVLVSETSREIWFPTLGDKSRLCQWICYNYLLSAKPADTFYTNLTFITGTKVKVPCNIRTIRLQMSRCERFLNMIDENCTGLPIAENVMDYLRK